MSGEEMRDRDACSSMELTATGACSLECWAYGSRTITKWY